MIQKIQEKSPFEFKDNKRSRPRTLKVIISKLYYSLNFQNEPKATREKVTQLLLYHGQFSKDEIDETFQFASRRTTDYSKEFLELHPELREAASKSPETENKIQKEEVETKKEEREILEEIKYVFPRYT